MSDSPHPLEREFFLQQQPLITLSPPMILFPSIVDEGTFFMLSWALELARDYHGEDVPILMRINGWGGHTSQMFSIVDLLQMDRNVYGYLYGENYSAHTIVWASCPKRFVFPNASLNIHNGALFKPEGVRENVQVMRRQLMSAENADRRMAKIYAAACENKTYDEDYWMHLMSGTSPDSFELIQADDIVHKYKMAKFVE